MPALMSETGPKTRVQPGRPLLHRIRTDRFTPIWLLAVVVFVISPVIAPGSMTPSALTAMLPFAGVMAIAALGQTLVITHGGIDLSVPGVMAIAAVCVTKLAQGNQLPTLVCVLLGIAAGAISGLAIGVAVVRFSVAAFVASLAVNSLLTGLVLVASGGFPGTADPDVSAFAVSSVAGIPTLFMLAVVLVVVAQLVLKQSVAGRRFVAVGASVPAARIAGLRTSTHGVMAYVLAGIAYASAGMLLAAYLRTPDLQLGQSYQLTTIAAVVLGGTLLRGGISSITATAVAALFLTQLGQVVLAAGASTAMQLLIQAVVLAAAIVLRGVNWRHFVRARSETTPTEPRKPSPTGESA
ncbi:ABC transporter permease [Mycolicibacterium goodii]|uniref:ABC transporter permease n=1 Tax=Mycolicibacterium goodii TaxID=134601 RepID=UPI000C26B20C|nr:ABC transporter permease [Mycolicibacterium goodii]PJK23416.1 ribose ABC transporter permease [Mycolicibacterium goodii]